MTTTSAPAPATPSRSRRIIAISLAIIAALVVAFFVFANLYADWQWYAQLGFESVLLTQWVARVVMFLVGFIGMAVPVWLAIQLAYRLRPVYARLSSQLDRYQEVVEPLRRLAMWGIPIFFGFFSGFAASAQWETTWLWFNGVATDMTDPQFNLDTGFYLFAMPFYSALLGFISAVLLVCLLVTALVAYLYGSVRIGQRELRISKAARIQLAVIAGLYLLVQAREPVARSLQDARRAGRPHHRTRLHRRQRDHPGPDDPLDRRDHRRPAVLRHRGHRPLALSRSSRPRFWSSRRSSWASATRGSSTRSRCSRTSSPWSGSSISAAST